MKREQVIALEAGRERGSLSPLVIAKAALMAVSE
jgi:hypothetical protein